MQRWMRSALVFSGIVGAATAPTESDAQERLAFTPTFATYFAVSRIQLSPDGDWEQQRAAPVLGAQLTFRPTPSFGIEVAGGYAFSSLIVTERSAANPVDLSLAGNVITAGGRVAFYPRRSNLKLFAGAGIVRRGGEIWDFPQFSELTDIAGVVGFTVRANVNPSIRLDIGLEANLYVADPDGADFTHYEERFQQDLLVTLGVPLALVR